MSTVAAAIAMVPIFDPVEMWVVLSALLGFTVGMVMALPGDALSPESRATGLGLYYTIYYIGTGILPAIAGWILGVVTSIPEMVSFFSVYAAASGAGKLRDLHDTQEALDNLTGSNMANVGVVYPIGLLAFLLGSSLLA